ncbi:MAG: hypothetical protein Q4D96_05460 [Propionibacteriaceae bacterium]|nr:hypothetical protein [Propionibacteriaceae bacterium]
MSTTYPPQPGPHIPLGRGNNAVVIALVVAIVLAVAGLGGWWLLSSQNSQQAQPQPVPGTQGQAQTQQPAPTPSETQEQAQQSQAPAQEQQEQSAEPPEPLPPVPSQKKPSGQETGKSRQGSNPAPPLPKQFAEFTFEKEGKTDVKYIAKDGRKVSIAYADYVAPEDLDMGDNTQTIRGWTCIKKQKEGQMTSVSCGGPAYEGVVVLGGAAVDYDLEDIADIADRLMMEWK